MTTTVLELSKGVMELGILAVIAAVAILGAWQMFDRTIKNYDKLAPAIDRQTKVMETQARNEEALRRQTEMLQLEVEQLREALSDHDDNSLAILDTTQKTLERLDVVSERLDKCLGKRGV